MAKRMKIDKEAIRALIGKKSHAAIAREVGCTPQYVSIIAKQGDGRGGDGHQPKTKSQTADALSAMSYDGLEKLALMLYERAMKTPTLEEEVKHKNNIIASLKNEVAVLRDKEQRRFQKETQFKIAKQQGILPDIER